MISTTSHKVFAKGFAARCSDLVSEQERRKDEEALERYKERFKRTGRGKRQIDCYLDAGFSPYWQVFGLSE